jgi:hypothetical protein
VQRKVNRDFTNTSNLFRMSWVRLHALNYFTSRPKKQINVIMLDRQLSAILRLNTHEYRHTVNKNKYGAKIRRFTDYDTEVYLFIYLLIYLYTFRLVAASYVHSFKDV